MKLTDEQNIILNNCLDNAYISAAPGSGKSTVLSKVCEKILNNDTTNFVLLLTFTNKAANSILDKCSSLDKTKVLGGTFHGICYKFMRQNGFNFFICDENKKRLIIKKLFNCHKDRDKFEGIYAHISKIKSAYPIEQDEQVDKYNTELEKYKLLDFDDLIYKFIELVNSNACGIPKITHILVDELQDTSGPQLEMLRVIQKKSNAIMIGAADDDQCQPGCTQVLTNTGYKRIDELNQKKDKIICLHNTKHAVDFSISSRLYSGDLFIIESYDKYSFCTDSHKWLVRWSNEAKSKHIIYLVQKGLEYKIDCCSIRDLNNTFKKENADALWMLKYNDNRLASYMWMSFLSIKYGFSLNRYCLFSTCSQLNALTSLFIDFKLRAMYPLLHKDNTNEPFKTQACNLVPNLMCIPIQLHDNIFTWKELTSIKTQPCQNVKVYSLDVKTHDESDAFDKTYICDNGLVTCNSIYAWRNARPENVKDFIDGFNCTIYNMGYNFRSGSKIVKHSSTLIENNKNRIPKIIRAAKTEQGHISEYKCDNAYSEIDYVVMKCQQNTNSEIAILYRNRLFKNHLEFALRKAGLTYTINDFLEIVDRSAIKCMLSILRICTKEFDIYDLQQAAKAIKGFGLATANKIEAEPGIVSQTFHKFSEDSKKKARLRSLIELQIFYNNHQDQSLELLIREIEKYFTKSFEYATEIREFLIDISKDYKINSNDIKTLYNELGLNGKEEHNDDKALIELSTVHGYKGCERQIVIIPWCDLFNEQRGKEYDIESERRLFYVAITRAKSKLYMSYSGNIPKFIKEMKI